MYLKRGTGRNQEFKKEQWLEIANLISESTCKVMVFRGREGLFGVHIELAGPLAHFPSTSNSREIQWMFAKGGFRNRKPFIGLTMDARARLKALTDLFTVALLRSGHPLPCFLDQEVRVLALFAKKGGRWDSHNQCKPLGDWLEHVGIINDDSRADIQCEKKARFPDAFTDQETTTIIIQPLHQIRTLVIETVREQIQTSTGALKLVG